MKLERLRQKLIAEARANQPSGRVPYAFEKRITALISALPLPDVWTLWGRALWRAAVPCVTVMLLFGAVSFVGPNRDSKPVIKEFSMDFEQTMLAAVDQPGEVW